MELNEKKLEELISAADKIVAANNVSQEDWFGEVRNADAVGKILGLSSQNPEKSYDLYYKNIQRFLGEFLPKDNKISKVIREEVCVLLAHKERSGLTYGARNGDSRMATTEDMEHLIDVLTEWSETPTDYFKLSVILMNKCKELGYVPQERDIQDYLQA